MRSLSSQSTFHPSIIYHLGVGHFWMVGPTHVHGFIEGEALIRRDEGWLKERTFFLF